LKSSDKLLHTANAMQMKSAQMQIKNAEGAKEDNDFLISPHRASENILGGSVGDADYGPGALPISSPDNDYVPASYGNEVPRAAPGTSSGADPMATGGEPLPEGMTGFGDPGEPDPEGGLKEGNF
jgi:hypothetical protein